jgi:diketogulonate reductase-like aldo/keto reductase
MQHNGHMSPAPAVPALPLPGGGQIPVIGYGTWPMRGDAAETAVTAALQAGYRHLDTATMYGNETEIGIALAASGLPREQLFLTTKIRAGDLGKESAVLRRSLRELRTDYVDLWLVHSPPPRELDRRQMWNAARELRDAGLARAIGVSNYDLAQLDELIKATGEAPAVNQIPWSPAQFDPDILAGHRDRGVILEGYSPIKDTQLGDPVLTGIAAAHDVTPAQVVLRWHLEHDIVVIPKSARPDRMAANLDLLGFSLTGDEVAAVNGLAAS